MHINIVNNLKEVRLLCADGAVVVVMAMADSVDMEDLVHLF